MLHIQQHTKEIMTPTLKTLLAIAIVKYLEGKIDIVRVLRVNTVLRDDLLQAEEPALYATATRLAYLNQQVQNGMKELLHRENIQGLLESILENLTTGSAGRQVFGEVMAQ